MTTWKPGKQTGATHRRPLNAVNITTNRPGSQPNERENTRPDGTTLTERLLEPYVIYKNEENGEWRLRCPFHYDVEGDCSLNLEKQVYFCFVCGGGPVSTLVDRLIIRAANGFVPAWLSEPLRGGSSPGIRRPPSGPPLPAVVAGWHNVLMRSPDRLAYLTDGRLLTIETIRRYELGWSREHGFFCLPIYDRSGQLVSFNRYRPDEQPKMLNRRGSRATLYPWSTLSTLGKGDRLVVCEGFWDSLLLNQSGIPAITGTNGARTWKRDWSIVLRLLGVRVVVIYDCDTAGREGARRIVRSLPGSRAVDLDPTRDDKYDLTNYLREHTVTELRSLIEGGSR